MWWHWRKKNFSLWGGKAEKFVLSIIFIMTDFHAELKKKIITVQVFIRALRQRASPSPHKVFFTVSLKTSQILKYILTCIALPSRDREKFR